MRAPLRQFIRCVVLAVAVAPLSAIAAAIEYRSVSDEAAVLYDGPTASSTKLYVVNKGYPLEVVVAVDRWVKVRDARGAFSWIEAAKLGERRNVMVKVPLGDVRAKPDEAAPLVFQAQENVLLELVGVTGGWVQVRHRDGATGFIRAQQVWGA